MKPTLYIKSCLALLLFWAAAGCQKDLLNTAPKTDLIGNTFWKSQKDAVNAVNAIYSKLPGISELQWDQLSDIGMTNNNGSALSEYIEKGAPNANLDFFGNQWKDAYTAIRAANYFLENVDKVKDADPNTADSLLLRLKGEARFIRAFFYTRLVMLFGDVPLITQTLELSEGYDVPRTPKNEVWDFVDKELTDIAGNLPERYTGDDIGRITRGAALAMKARAMLYAGRWQAAADAAKAVMDLNVYSLYPSFAKLFGYAAEHSSEVILDREYAKDVLPSSFFNTYAPKGMNGTITIAPTGMLADAFETSKGLSIDKDPDYNPRNPYHNRDPRLGYTLFLPAFSDDVPGDKLYNGKPYDPRPGSHTADEVEVDYLRSKTGFNTKKYVNPEDMSDRSNCGTDFILIRYADVLLMYAEAKTELNQIDGAVYDAVNAIRTRSDVNMPPVPAGRSQEQMRQIVRHERMVELAMEGLRFFDLRRWKTAEKVMQGAVRGMTYIRSGGATVDTVVYGGIVRHFNPDRDYLFPIPQQEVLLNSKLTQNPGF
ncbi:RagB/SusD family nutrient uptake outer membrane protein [Compostibacter hankyongensis]|uniref:RagB/SusD family nutrient uptake outer membrane protein n=1 Tax=Compostibacter hankyongensis TaxID=1007089 RepID=A0ABP8FBX7_9BACT